MFPKLSPRLRATTGAFGYSGVSRCGGRITPSSNDPFQDGVLSNYQSFYLTPAYSRRLVLWDGTRDVECDIKDVPACSLVGSGVSSGTTYYVYAGLVGAAPRLEFSTTAPAIDVTAQDGIPYKTGDRTRLYMGMMRCNGSEQYPLIVGNRGLVNYYNPILYDDFINDVADNWTDAGNGTWSAIDGGAAAWVQNVLIPWAGFPVAADALVMCQTEYQICIALDTSTTPDRTKTSYGGGSNAGATLPTTCSFADRPTAGFHTVNGLETTASVTTRTAYGDNGAGGGGGILLVNSGMRVRAYR